MFFRTSCAVTPVLCPEQRGGYSVHTYFYLESRRTVIKCPITKRIMAIRQPHGGYLRPRDVTEAAVLRGMLRRQAANSITTRKGSERKRFFIKALHSLPLRLFCGSDRAGRPVYSASKTIFAIRQPFAPPVVFTK